MIKRPSKRASSKTGSLLTPASMGGIVAGKGFDFQTRYTVCHLPLWLKDSTFYQIFSEGTGDIDIRYVDNGKFTRVHVQVKDHEVTPSEFREVVEAFRVFDAGFPNVYQRFTLACPSLSSQLRSIENGLARFRNAKPFYDDNSSALDATKVHLDGRMAKQKLTDEQIQFIHEKVFIEVGHSDLAHDERALDLFIARILSHPEFAGKIRAMVQPAFSEIMRTVGASKGAVLDRAALEAILRSSILADMSHEKSVTVWVHNWTKETFDPAADFELDWSALFDRPSRKVPLPEIWDDELLPELSKLRQDIIAVGTARTIRLRGKCTLSAGIAIGATFPAVGGWVFEVPQPPSKVLWRSDATPTANYDLQVEVLEGDPQGSDLVVGLNIRGDGRQDIFRFIEETAMPPKVFVFMSPSTQGAQSLGGAEDACAMARMVRDRLGEILKSQQLRTTRLFFYGPFGLAVFLGQYLTSMGQVKLFEYQDPGYAQSCTLQT